MSMSVRSALKQHNGVIRLIETHDPFSTEVIRNTGEDEPSFEGVWISGLTQTTYLGIPDTELISPLHRSSMKLPYSRNENALCAAFDADSGGKIVDALALKAFLIREGVSMIIIEDKELTAPGTKVNSLLSAAEPQSQADPYEFAKKIKAFKQGPVDIYGPSDSDFMVTARIESFNLRIEKDDLMEEAASVQRALDDALKRADIYTEAGADAIMIHSKSKNASEVLGFLRNVRLVDKTTPLVIVPTTYCTTSRQTLIDAGANIIIYANHLMRAKVQAIEPIVQSFLAANPELFSNDEKAKACLDAKNYGCLLRILLERDFEDGKNEEAKRFLVAAQKSAIENMRKTVEELAMGTESGCEADEYIITVKQLLGINAVEVAKPYS
ncbi:hypothetical protein N7478_009500 [Penicillium angulare]|uniref:uncharacterized protein n=1 Tax=Penicillium angulare TaxID=116970 RepID=UPI0025404A22|nr:uncharacterized protein N7478_009500 [Penicillium angulare]KAJ5266692.1 hypothetical protein N7478_009500 [Penicillium angulare]